MKKRIIIIYCLFISVLTVFSQEVEDAKKLFKSYTNKINALQEVKRKDSAAIYINHLEQLLPILNDSSYFYKIELIKGSQLTRTSKYDEAMKKLLKATSFFKMQQDWTNYYSGKYRIGVCYYYINRREDAQIMMNEVLNNSKCVSEQTKINALSNLGALEIELGMLNHNDTLIQNSKVYLRKAIALNLKNNNFSNVTNNYSLLAEAYNQLNDREQALKLLDSAVYFAIKGKNKTNEAFALVKKANIYTAKKQLHKALPLINKAIAIYQKVNHIPTKIYAFGEKKKLLVAMQNYKAANVVSDSIYELSILNYNKRFVDGISEMKVKYNTAKKERKILEQRTDLAEQGLLIQKRNYQILAIVGFALLLFIIGYFIHKQQKLKNEQLKKENSLKIALQKIETQNKLQEQRLRISRDLHDNIGAQLSFIISSIDNLKFVTKDSNPEIKDKLTYISSFTTTTIQQLRDTIWAMNKNEISIDDLQSRILSFIENAKKTNEKINISLKMDVKSPIIFTSIKGIHIFRVIQEAINNALKYAKADEILVEITELNDELNVTITDDGKGFDFETITFGNGLKNMQDRMDEVGAKFKIDSTHKGTIISVSCKREKTAKV